MIAAVSLHKNCVVTSKTLLQLHFGQFCTSVFQPDELVNNNLWEFFSFSRDDFKASTYVLDNKVNIHLIHPPKRPPFTCTFYLFLPEKNLFHLSGVSETGIYCY